MELASTMVVISGEAISAGSRPIFFAHIGRMQPSSFAEITVATRDRAMTTAIPAC